jgi:hypothetical protein
VSRRPLGALEIVAIVVLVGVVLTSRAGRSAHVGVSPPAPQENSPVRGLRAQEVDDLRNGRGAGDASKARLNHYPDPCHVLDAQRELGLSRNQARPVGLVFEQMPAEATRLGHAIVQRERHVGAAFTRGTIAEAEIRTQTENLARRYGQRRSTHLRAHLHITPLLSPNGSAGCVRCGATPAHLSSRRRASMRTRVIELHEQSVA